GAGEQRVLLEPVEVTDERRERGGDLGIHAAVHCVQLARIFVVALQTRVAVELFADARVFGRDLCRALGVVPEAGLAHLRLELGAAGRQRNGVKGNHGPRQAWIRSPRVVPPAVCRTALPSRSMLATALLGARADERLERANDT